MEDINNEKERLNTLKERADKIGLNYSPNIKAETLANKIENFLNSNGVSVPNPDTDTEDNDSNNDSPVVVTDSPKLSKAQHIAKLAKDSSKLVRIVLTCNDPSKSQWSGEVFTVGNAVIPTQKKYIPFGVEWHVPVIMLNMLREMQYSKSTKIKHADGSFERKVRQYPKYNIEVRPPITQEEFEHIKHRQNATKNIGDE